MLLFHSDYDYILLLDITAALGIIAIL